ncbi:glycerol-3-phosphate dehydrogenase [Candidatus Marinamargulisbacteria bacterium SCGC AG-414-C22]|nr:glycerol-3-phosphate dehydrogenase [Candidatus Marinamargulisbacteria bacterium SCGC AG-414-C22]
MDQGNQTIKKLDLAQQTQFDLAIIGGGINGAAIARDASLRGLSVFLCDKNTFGSGTSSKSSKLAHGGLRYLEQFELGLVKESLLERNLLLELAADYVKPLSFVLPIYQSSKRPRWFVYLGMQLYKWLSSSSYGSDFKSLSKQDICNLTPLLDSTHLKGGFLYYDAQMLDYELVLANILAAQEQGAVLCSNTGVTDFVYSHKKISGIKVVHQDKTYSIHANCILNATGPWLDVVQQLATKKQRSSLLSPTKGVHIIVKDIGLSYALTLEHPSDGRVFFIIPWKGKTLVGTTDTVFTGNPDKLCITPEDCDYLLTGLNEYLSESLVSTDILDSFVGLRPLAFSSKSASAKSRDFSLLIAESGLVSIFGGKYTTYRLMAEKTVDKIVSILKKSDILKCETMLKPLPTLASVRFHMNTFI